MLMCAIHTSYHTRESIFVVKAYFAFDLLIFAHVNFYIVYFGHILCCISMVTSVIITDIVGLG